LRALQEGRPNHKKRQNNKVGVVLAQYMWWSPRNDKIPGKEQAKGNFDIWVCGEGKEKKKPSRYFQEPPMGKDEKVKVLTSQTF